MQINPKIPAREALIAGVHADTGDARRRMRQFLQENIPLLLGIIRSYVVHTGLAYGETVQAIATDILHDTVLEALAHADRCTATTQQRAWFLAIAANVLKRRKADYAKRQQREVLISDLPAYSGVNDFFDQVMDHIQPGPEQSLETDEQVVEMLSLVSPDDQEVLRLALLQDLNTNMLAQVLGVTPGAARVRLHRALNRLRMAWSKGEKKGERNA